MTIWLILGWWFIGFVSLLTFPRDYELTWGILVGYVFMGLILGPLFWVSIGIIIVVQAEFWHKPVFPRRKSEEQDQ